MSDKMDMCFNSIRTQQGVLLTIHPYWKDKATTIAISDDALKLIHSFARDIERIYKNDHIALQEKGHTNNFAIFTPKVDFFKLGIKQPKSEEFKSILDERGLKNTYVLSRKLQYIYLSREQIKNNKDFLIKILREAYEVPRG